MLKNFVLFTVVIAGCYGLAGVIKEMSNVRKKRFILGFLCSIALTIIGMFAVLGLLQSIIP